MIVKMIDTFGTGRAVPMLCYDDGTVVPGQVQTKLESGAATGRPTVTITLVIDGKNHRSE